MDIQLGNTVKVVIDYGRQLTSYFILKIDDCSLVSAEQSLTMVENTQIHQVDSLKF